MFLSKPSIFIKVGAWGCFDEFNRLEERMLSAVSQQVQTIQEALKSHQEGDNTGIDIFFWVLYQNRAKGITFTENTLIRTLIAYINVISCKKNVF